MKERNVSSGKKLLKVLVSISVILVHVLRPLSIAVVLMGVLGLSGVFDFHMSHLTLLIIGLVMALSFIVPINGISLWMYKQRVLDRMLSIDAADVSYELAKEPEPKRHGIWVDIVVGVAVNLVTMIIQHWFFE